MKKIIIFLIIIICFLLSAYLFFENKNRQQLEANKKIVVTFLDAAVNKKDFNAASKYLGSRYIQHDPDVADGPEALKNFIQFLREKFPNARTEIKQVYAEGDHVIIYVHSIRVPGTRGRAIVDIFKLEDNKIVEHWEVVQDIPEKSANQNGMF